MEELFGSTLLTAAGEKPTNEVLNGASAIGIYFSAHWCPPCRSFTPKLAASYKDAYEAKGFRIVFVSSDRSEDEFKEYFGEMPWVALPYAQRSLKDKLSKKFKVNGIPNFVVLGPDGTVITKDGREAASQDPKGERFPWIPPTKEETAKKIMELIGGDILSQTEGKHIGLYFSAHWCPPCRGFTPKLAEYYTNGLKDKLSIIFVSSDRDQQSYDDYFKEMPWLALPFDKRSEKEELSRMCGVSGIPSFTILNPDGTLVTNDGRGAVLKDPTGAELPEGWLPQPFNDVNDDPSALNEEQCVIAMGASEELAGKVKAVAMAYYESAGKDLEKMPMRFYKAPEGGVEQQLRKLTKVEGDAVVLLDIPSDGAFFVCPNDTGVQDFVDSVLAGKAERKQLQK